MSDETGPNGVATVSLGRPSASTLESYLNLVTHQAHCYHSLKSSASLSDLEIARNSRHRFKTSKGTAPPPENSPGCHNLTNLAPKPGGDNEASLLTAWEDPPGEDGSNLREDLDSVWNRFRLQDDCPNKTCQTYAGKMRATVARCRDCSEGTCAFETFRSSAIMAMSCQLALCPDPYNKSLQVEGGMDQFIKMCDRFVETTAILVHTHISTFVAACVQVLAKHTNEELGEIRDESQSEESCVRSAIDIIYWMANIQYEKGIGVKGFGSWQSRFVASASSKEHIWRAYREAHDLKICEHRVWTLIEVSDRKRDDLPDVVSTLKLFDDIIQEGEEGKGTSVRQNMRWLHDTQRCVSLEALEPGSSSQECHHGKDEACPHLKHWLCSPSKCQMSTMDSTGVKSLHRSGDCDCEWPQASQDEEAGCTCEWEERKRTRTQPEFWDKVTSAAVEEDLPTAWRFPDTPGEAPTELVGKEDTYVALSHVWADGTGGTPTKCMFQFFQDYAQKPVKGSDDGCKGIWWDAMSVPTTKKKRSKALASMHLNYSRATYTIVHDRGILDISWSPDKPEDLCLALVLSTWFTRAWTALELAVSKSIKVLVKNPDEPKGDPLLLDLDDDILAFGPECVSRAHWIAKAWIRRLREPVDDIGDITAILSRRTSSFGRDQVVVGALLADVANLDMTASEAEMIEKTLQYLPKIPYEGLMHGQPTMTERGGLSWSPCTIADMQTGQVP